MISWNRIILDNHVAGSDLSEQIDALFAQQRENWPLLRAGLAALGQVQSKVLALDGAQIVLQSNPGRKASTHAKVDAKTIVFPLHVPPNGEATITYTLTIGY